MKVLLIVIGALLIPMATAYSAPYTVLSSPADGYTMTGASIRLDWYGERGGGLPVWWDSQVQFWPDSAFKSTVLHQMAASEFTIYQAGGEWLPDNCWIYWRARLNWSDVWGNYWTPWTGTRKFRTDFPGLDTELPTEGAVGVSQRPTFDWSGYYADSLITGGVITGGFIFQIDTISDFSSPALWLDTISGTGCLDGWELPPTARLAGGQTYYWHALCLLNFYSGADIAKGGWTNVASFTTGCSEHMPPVVSGPADGAAVAGPDVDLIWISHLAHEDYEVQIDDDESFLSPLQTTAVSGSGYTLTGVTEGATYYWRTRANFSCGNSDWTETRQFTVLCPVPETPVPTDPPNGSSGNPLELTYLQWEEVVGCDLYYVEVDNNADFSSPVFVANTDQTNELCTDLATVTTYHWRVRAYDQTCGFGAFSTTWTFTTECVEPDAAGLLDPPDEAVELEQPVTLDWGDVDGATGYEIQVDDSTDLGTLLVHETISGSEYLLDSVEQGVTCYWRVRATNNCTSGQWSPLWSFTTRVPTGVVEADDEILPGSYYLSHNYPNPFNPSTTFEFGLPVSQYVRIDVLNILGKRIETLVSEVLPSGSWSVTWDGRNTEGRSATSGVYFYRMTAGEYSQTRKMVLVK